MPAPTLSQEATVLTNTLRQQFAAMPTANMLGPKEAEVVYTLGYSMIEQRRYEQAHDAFHVLVSFRPLERKFWLGYGYALKMLQRYEEAIHAYSMLGVLHPDSPDATLHVAECQLRMGQTDQAKASLKIVLDYCEQYTGHEAVGARAKAISQLVHA